MIEAGLQEPVIKVGNLESLRTYADMRDAVRPTLCWLPLIPFLVNTTTLAVAIPARLAMRCSSLLIILP